MEKNHEAILSATIAMTMSSKLRGHLENRYRKFNLTVYEYFQMLGKKYIQHSEGFREQHLCDFSIRKAFYIGYGMSYPLKNSKFDLLKFTIYLFTWIDKRQ